MSEPACAQPRIVHFGFGNFHRAHQAHYTQLANQRSETAWRITGISPRSGTVRDRLKQQQWRYHLLIDDGADATVEQIAVHDSVICSADNPDDAVAALADPATRIVSFTITEKAYRPEAATAAGNWLSLLAEGLQQRLDNKRCGVTLLCCDNLPANGRVLRSLVLGRLADRPNVRDWTASNCTFPCTMVDRIVPRTTDALKTRLRDEFGIEDSWPVQTEGFSQWVIEDSFAAGSPPWGDVGAEIVADAGPFESMKLAFLNGSHTYLAYAGLLRGHQFVHQAIADTQLRIEVEQLWDELEAVAETPEGYDIKSYRKSLLLRYENSSLEHRLAQVAMDGSQKLPARIVPNLNACLKSGFPSKMLQRAVAAWAAFCLRQVARGEKLDDPAAEQISSAAAAGPEALLELPAIFGDCLSSNPKTRSSIADMAATLAVS